VGPLVKLSKPTKEEIERLRADAYALVNFPELLDDPQWRPRAFIILQAFIAQNPHAPLGPRGIAALVDEIVDSKVKQGMPLAEAIEFARGVFAKMLSESRDNIRKAHLRYGKRGVTKAP